MSTNTTLLKYGKEVMLKYGSFVIEDRSLADFRDGLKPVQRRSLWALYRLGLTPDKLHKKAARIVGEVIGKYHPHGDQAVYGTLVRMGGVPEKTSALSFWSLLFYLIVIVLRVNDERNLALIQSPM